ncbi:hypothetical protein LXL04_011767 [Taraxacum kok-saghyz]
MESEGNHSSEIEIPDIQSADTPKWRTTCRAFQFLRFNNNGQSSDHYTISLSINKTIVATSFNFKTTKAKQLGSINFRTLSYIQNQIDPTRSSISMLHSVDSHPETQYQLWVQFRRNEWTK